MYRTTKKLGVGIALALAIGAVALPAQAKHANLPEPGDRLYSTGGTFDVTIVPSTAALRNELYVRVNGGDRIYIADNSNPGEVVTDIGPFDLGDELIFEIDTFHRTSGTYYDTWSSGPGERNRDGQPHAVAIECGVHELDPQPCGEYGEPGDLYVGFEDLSADFDPRFGRSWDHDYDDHVFLFMGSLTRRVPTTLVAHPSIVDVNLSPVGDIYLQVSATLTHMDSGEPLAFEEITFHATGPVSLTGADPMCTAKTDSTGLASCGFLLEDPLVVLDTVLGIGQYEARFAGHTDAQEASDIGPIVSILGTELLAT